MKTDSLNSNDSFVLRNVNTYYIWYGTGCNKNERSYAQQFVDQLKGSIKCTIQNIEEGNEDYEFWRLLGGKMSYTSSAALQDYAFEARLFFCSNASESFKVEEITNFSQDDLSKNDVMILDAYNEVFVWVGSESNAIEKKMAMETAAEFVQQAKDKRSLDIPISRTIEGQEPYSFTSHFTGWESSKTPGTPRRTERVTDVLEASNKKYTYQQLVKKPPGVDSSKLELYLLSEEFVKVFGITEEEFFKLPNWKQVNLKKQTELF